MIRNLLLSSALTLGVVAAAQADSDTSPYAVTSPSGEVIRSSNGEVVTIGGTLVEPESDRDQPERSRPAPSAPAGASST